MRRILSVFLCMILVITLTGCNSILRLLNNKKGESVEPVGDNVDGEYYSGVERDFSPLFKTNISSDDYQFEIKQISKQNFCSSPYDKVTQGNGYNSLESDALKEAYRNLEEAVYNIYVEKDMNGYYPVQRVVIKNENIPEELIRKLICAFDYDHSFEFWVANVFGFAYLNSDTIIQVYSSLSPDDCNGAIKQLETRVNTILNNIPNGLTEYERELYIHNWLLDNCEYDSDAIYLKNKWAPFNVYGAVVVGKAVCEGYSRAMQLLLNQVGIYCRVISGDVKNNPHMWNLVYINKDWYHLDATWNDSPQFRKYNYFNVDDDVIEIDHKIYPDFNSFTKEEICGTDMKSVARYNINIPECFSDDANYFNVESIKIRSLGRDVDSKIINEIYEKVVDGEKSVSFQVSESLSYENTIAKMFTQSPYKFLFYVDSVNEMLDDKKIDKDNIVYSEAESQRAIIVQLNFI